MSVSHPPAKLRKTPRNDSVATGNFTKLEEPVSETQNGRWGHDVEVQGGRGGREPEDEISLEEMNVPEGGYQGQGRGCSHDDE